MSRRFNESDLGAFTGRVVGTIDGAFWWSAPDGEYIADCADTARRTGSRFEAWQLHQRGALLIARVQASQKRSENYMRRFFSCTKP